MIDKSQKGDVAEAQRLAAEQIALGRVERERHIEATQERVEPLSEMEESETAESAIEAAPPVEQPTETGDAGKRRSRRGRRRGRSTEGHDEYGDASASSGTRIKPEEIDTPLSRQILRFRE